MVSKKFLDIVFIARNALFVLNALLVGVGTAFTVLASIVVKEKFMGTLKDATLSLFDKGITYQFVDRTFRVAAKFLILGDAEENLQLFILLGCTILCSSIACVASLANYKLLYALYGVLNTIFSATVMTLGFFSIQNDQIIFGAVYMCYGGMLFALAFISCVPLLTRKNSKHYNRAYSTRFVPNTPFPDYPTNRKTKSLQDVSQELLKNKNYLANNY